MLARKRICRTCRAIGFAWIFLLVTVIASEAHNVTVFAWVDGDTVRVESKFSGGRRPNNAPVEVFDEAGNLLVSGNTDSEGKFSFPIPRKTELKVVLHAGMGHRAEWIIAAEELEGADLLPAAGNQPPLRQAPQRSEPADGPAASALSGGPTAADIEQAVEKALDRKLKPLMQMLAASRQSGPDLRDILGGIGYIIGLVGLAAYLRSRRSGRSAGSPAADSDPPTTDPS